MKVRSTNIAERKTIRHGGKLVDTGIFKIPTDLGIYLDTENVQDDIVCDRKHHGGVHKACYLFSTDDYPYWQGRYPKLDWDWGMFGENLSVEGLDEATWRIGDILKIGEAVVQISMPREPCFKLGVRFGNPGIIGEFIDHGRSGAYVRILEKGPVRATDAVVLLERSQNPLTLSQCFALVCRPEKNPAILELALENEAFPQYKKEKLAKYGS